MVLTFGVLRDRVMRLVDETLTTGPTTDVLVGELLNAANQQRAVEYPWEFMLWPEEVTLTTVVGQTSYALHQEFHRPLYFWDVRSNTLLQEVPMRMLAGERLDGTSHDPAQPQFYFSGVDCVMRQPAGKTLSLVSDSASDVSPKEVLIKGETSDGDVVIEGLILTGTTPVVSGYTYDRILEITKSAEFTGTLTVRDSDANLLVRLSPSEMGRQYRMITLLHAPTVASNIRYRFFRAPLKMVNDYDKSAIPGAHAQLLVWDTLVLLSAYLTQSSPSSISIWRQMQQEAQVALYTAYANDQQSLGALPAEIAYTKKGWTE